MHSEKNSSRFKKNDSFSIFSVWKITTEKYLRDLQLFTINGEVPSFIQNNFRATKFGKSFKTESVISLIQKLLKSRLVTEWFCGKFSAANSSGSANVIPFNVKLFKQGIDKTVLITSKPIQVIVSRVSRESLWAFRNKLRFSLAFCRNLCRPRLSSFNLKLILVEMSSSKTGRLSSLSFLRSLFDIKHDLIAFISNVGSLSHNLILRLSRLLQLTNPSKQQYKRNSTSRFFKCLQKRSFEIFFFDFFLDFLRKL